MLASLTLTMLLAQAPAETPPPPPLPEPKVHTDTSRLPLDILNDLPAPAAFDYDGDQAPEAVTIGLTKTGQLTVSAKSTRTGKVQVLYTSKGSPSQLGATHAGLKAFGDPKSQVTMEVWTLKGNEKLLPVTLGLTPGAITLSAEGKHHDFTWSGTAFKTKTK